MIKFNCPGCQTAFSVSDDKAGKKGKCPKCQSAFVIPQAPAGSPAPAPAPVPPPPPPVKTADPDEPVEIEPCPGCGAVLTVAPEFLGADVECPSCNSVFAATKPGDAKPKPSPQPEAPPQEGDGAFAGFGDAEEEPPKKKKKTKRVEEDDEEPPEEERPKKKKSKALAKIEEDEEEPADDEDDDDRPRKKKKGGKVESKRTIAGILALLAGNLGVHKFYLGYTMPGVIMLLTCGGCGIVSLIEGIKYLTATDEDFLRKQQAGKKPWF